MTNYEKIKNMSVEEMAEFFKGECNFCALHGKCRDFNSCHEGHKQWLESEAEND